MAESAGAQMKKLAEGRLDNRPIEWVRIEYDTVTDEFRLKLGCFRTSQRAHPYVLYRIQHPLMAIVLQRAAEVIAFNSSESD